MFGSKSPSPVTTTSATQESTPSESGPVSSPRQSPSFNFVSPSQTVASTAGHGFDVKPEVSSIFGLESKLTTAAPSIFSSPTGNLTFGAAPTFNSSPKTTASGFGFTSTPTTVATASAFATSNSSPVGGATTSGIGFTGELFGANPSAFGTFTSSSATGGLFGANPKTTASQIGYTPNLSTTAATTSAFGTFTSSSATGGLFGANPKTTASQIGYTPNLSTTAATTSAFGTFTSSSATGGLFGANPKTTASQIGYTPNLSTTAATTSAFGTFTSSSATGGLFGANPGTRLLFGAQPNTTASGFSFTSSSSTTAATSGTSTPTPSFGAAFGISKTTASFGFTPVFTTPPATPSTSSFGTPISSVAFGATPTLNSLPNVSPSATTTAAASAAVTATTPAFKFATVTTQAWNAFHTLNTSSMSSGGLNFNRPRLSLAQGTTHAKFIPLVLDDWDDKRGIYKTFYMCITTMKEYHRKSLEELRFEDRQLGKDKCHKQFRLLEDNDEFIKQALEATSVDWPTFDVLNMSTSALAGAETTLNNLSENMDAMQKSLDKFRLDTDSKFCESYSQQIEQHLAMKNITKLLMNIDKKIDNEENLDTGKLDEVLLKLENCKAKLRVFEDKLDECQKEISNLKESNKSLEEKCRWQRDKIEQCEADIVNLKNNNKRVLF